MSVSLWDLGKPVYDKHIDDLDEQEYRTVIHHKRLLLPRFKELYNSCSPPKHPYKIMMRIRKEDLEISSDKKHRFGATVKALELLKEDFEEDWKNRVQS